MAFNKIYNKINNKWDLKYSKYTTFQSSLTEDIQLSRLFEILADLYEVEVTDFEDISPEQLELITSKLNRIVTEEAPLISRFKIKNKEYGLVPNFSKITAGELIDLDTLFVNNDIIGLISILYRPVKKKQFNPFNIFGQTRYTIEKYKEPQHEIFAEVPLAITQGALSFFLNSYQRLN